MVTNPEQEFRKIYQFLDEPYFNHSLNNLDQVKLMVYLMMINCW